MFPLGKLHELSPRTRQRKMARLIQGLEMDIAAGKPLDGDYILGALTLLGSEAPIPVRQAARDAAQILSRQPGSPGTGSPAVLRCLNALRHAILRELGAEPSEWDLLTPGTGILDRSGVRIIPVTVYLEDIRSPFNVGSIFRTAEAFGVQRILLSPRTPLPSHPRAAKTARGAEKALSWKVSDLEDLGGNEGIFALELGGTPIREFPFPTQGAILLGSEELGLSPEALRLADQGLGRVSIPLAGAKRSLNVSVAFGILMNAWSDALTLDLDR